MVLGPILTSLLVNLPLIPQIWGMVHELRKKMEVRSKDMMAIECKDVCACSVLGLVVLFYLSFKPPC